MIQSRGFGSYDETNYNKVFKYASLMFNESHWAVERANQLLQWADSYQYQNVLDRKANLNQPSQEVHFCPKCGKKQGA